MALLISNRLRVLDLPRSDLLRRAGYKNITKGLRRLHELVAGELVKTRDLIRALPAALGVPPEVVDQAIEETRRRIAEVQEATEQAREAAWRAAFKPHAIIVTERTVPQPFFVAAFIGVERLLRIDFDLALAPVNYTNQALTDLRRRLTEFKSEALPAFGCPTGVIVNYTPDRAVRFDLNGDPVEVLPHTSRLADPCIGTGRRLLGAGTLRTIMSVE